MKSAYPRGIQVPISG